ncbi:ExbD/TolR family protein [Pedobacter jamesrossensis]|uniref:ExbD/TolR family protein n=1 Tax=Pedobacter jamesrossensis TaxID=1908238 RepID=A0ABV8NKM6_9SPHI
MATLEISKGGKATNGRTQKTAPRVDLTAMVDLMFLLTTFFMLTTSLTEMKAADISKPTPINTPTPYPASRTMTILLGKSNQAGCYMGETYNASIKITKVRLIEKEIIKNKLLVAKTHQNNPEKYLIVIIKPMSTSTYKNLVDVIDEMKITGVKSYAITDENTSLKEETFMKQEKL